ncbi:MAG: hypothetical protein F4213_16760 [Boseongicola sp. SB0677_bin_26]|nr:hypothetical protein [Boseongicola sp. SB0665_bin_10]MYG27644.1 hypothetical protein [Boseongicola sp. SB0677_bin_26]
MATSARTVRVGALGKRKLRLVEKDGRFNGLVDGKKCVDGPDADDVWRQLHDDAGKADPKYFGHSGARSRFLKFFPNGFHSDGFLSQEREYKLAAKKRLDANAPLTAALSGSGFGEAVLSAFHATNMLSPFEKTRVAGMVRGPDADAFVQAAAGFALDGTKAALLELERVLKAQDCAKWTVATYLPFLWRPETHMYLKPEATKEFAVRVGHPLASLYQAQLDVDVYASLLDLVDRTANELSDLAPRDRIDIQSFIWVVGDYREDREGVYP